MIFIIAMYDVSEKHKLLTTTDVRLIGIITL